MRAFIREFNQVYRIGQLSSSTKVLTYYVLLGLFPLVLMLSNIALVWGFSGDDINQLIFALAPKRFAHIIISSLVLVNPSGMLHFSWENWLSALLNVWAASRGVVGVRQTLNMVYGVPGEATNWVMRLVVFVSTLIVSTICIALGLLASLGVVVFRKAADFNGKLFSWELHLLHNVSWIGLIVLGWFVLFWIYKTFANARIHTLSAAWAALVALLGSGGLTVVFAWYLRFFATRTLSYGFFGSVMAFLLWLNCLAWCLLLGAVLCAVVERRRYGKITPRRAPIGPKIIHPKQPPYSQL